MINRYGIARVVCECRCIRCGIGGDCAVGACICFGRHWRVGVS